MVQEKPIPPARTNPATTDEFRTIEREARSEMKVQGSRFLARALPAVSREAAEAGLQFLRREYHDASHWCFAWRVGTTGTDFRFSDDGEPSGTAGKPILNAIDHHGLTNVLVVVTRYFGGTKLGTGGLTRAYADTAAGALAGAAKMTQFLMKPVLAAFPHAQTGNVMRIVSSPGILVRETRYDDHVHLVLDVRASLLDSLKARLTEATAGQCVFSDV